MTEPKRKNMHFEVDAQDIVNIFQISNPEILVVSQDKTEIANLYLNMIAMLKKFGATSTPAMDNADAMREITIARASSDSGGFIMSSILKTVGEDAEIQKWLFIIIGEVADFGEEIKDPAQRYQARANFILAGIVKDEKQFIVRDCIARIRTDDNNIMVIRPDTMDDYYSIMLYGDAAFRAMVTNDEIDIDKYAFYLDPSVRQSAKYDYEEISRRTVIDLAQYMIECADADQPQASQALTLSPCPILQ